VTVNKSHFIMTMYSNTSKYLTVNIPSSALLQSNLLNDHYVLISQHISCTVRFITLFECVISRDYTIRNTVTLYRILCYGISCYITVIMKTYFPTVFIIFMSLCRVMSHYQAFD
jgi:hypothetical protein